MKSFPPLAECSVPRHLLREGKAKVLRHEPFERHCLFNSVKKVCPTLCDGMVMDHVDEPSSVRDINEFFDEVFLATADGDHTKPQLIHFNFNEDDNPVGSGISPICWQGAIARPFFKKKKYTSDA